MKTMRPFIFMAVLFCLIGYQLTSSALFSNLVRNPGFESFDANSLLPTGWSCTTPSEKEQGGIFIDKDIKWKGEVSLRITQSQKDSYNYAIQGLAVQKNTKYKLTAYAKASDIKKLSSTSMGPRIFIGDSKGNAITSKLIASNDWEQVSFEFDTGLANFINVTCYLHLASGSVWFDDLKLEVSK